MAESKQVFFASLMNQYIHQNGLLWSRVQTLSVLQGAVIAGAFAITSEKPVYYNGLLLLGILLTGLLFPVILRDMKVRECNRAVLEHLGKTIDDRFVLNPPPPKWFPVKGDHIIFVALALLLLVDFALLCVPVQKLYVSCG